jgi:NAD(P)-dependent dehydrogenase (short-subunit alcohol dehydrogenase family)
VLVNNAGIAGFIDMLEPGALQAFDRVLAVNLRGTFMCSKVQFSYARYQHLKRVLTCTCSVLCGVHGEGWQRWGDRQH